MRFVRSALSRSCSSAGTVYLGLLGEPNPFGLMHHVAEIPNPFPGLCASTIPEESLRPIARLLISEIMITERGVERITDFALGQPIRDRHRLRLGWQASPPHTGQATPPTVEVDGGIAW